VCGLPEVLIRRTKPIDMELLHGSSLGRVFL
jgi:hypothetical protein